MQLHILQNEILKTKNTPAIWITVIGGAFLPVMLAIAYLNEWENFIPLTGVNPWLDFYGRLVNGLCICTPLFICLVTALIFHVDHKAMAWRLTFTLPVSKKALFIHKLILVTGIIAIYFLLFLLFSIVTGKLLGLIHREFLFLPMLPDYREVISAVTKAFVCNLGIIAIQFWLSFRINNVVTTLGIGIAAVITGLLAKDSERTFLFAYVDPFKMLGYFYRPHHFWENYVWVSLSYFGIVILFSYIDFTRWFKG
jgi:hypothetical protein